MRFFPAIDVIDGRAVRLRQGDYGRAREFGSFGEILEVYLKAGVEGIHIVDLSGAREPANRTNRELILSTLAGAGPGLPLVELGGGLRSVEEIEEVLLAGVERVVLGTGLLAGDGFAKSIPAELRKRIVVSLDFREVDGVRQVAIDAWTRTLSTTLGEAVERFAGSGFDTFLVTNIARDGMANGPDLAVYRDLVHSFPVKVIASGGVRTAADLGALSGIGSGRGALDAVVVGTAVFEGRLGLEEGILACRA